MRIEKDTYPEDDDSLRSSIIGSFPWLDESNVTVL
jgi:hypothetical protein